MDKQLAVLEKELADMVKEWEAEKERVLNLDRAEVAQLQEGEVPGPAAAWVRIFPTILNICSHSSFSESECFRKIRIMLSYEAIQFISPSFLSSNAIESVSTVRKVFISIHQYTSIDQFSSFI